MARPAAQGTLTMPSGRLNASERFTSRLSRAGAVTPAFEERVALDLAVDLFQEAIMVIFPRC